MMMSKFRLFTERAHVQVAKNFGNVSRMGLMIYTTRRTAGVNLSQHFLFMDFLSSCCSSSFLSWGFCWQSWRLFVKVHIVLPTIQTTKKLGGTHLRTCKMNRSTRYMIPFLQIESFELWTDDTTVKLWKRCTLQCRERTYYHPPPARTFESMVFHFHLPKGLWGWYIYLHAGWFVRYVSRWRYRSSHGCYGPTPEI